MADTRFDQLTVAQRECLRLVLTHHSSKEIAARLKLSPSAVDKRIERAVRILDVPSRFAAARMLADHEGGFEPVVDRPAGEVINLPKPAMDELIDASMDPTNLVRRLLGLSPSVETEELARNKLSKLGRFGVILLLALVVALALMALLNFGETLSQLLLEYKHAHSH